MGLVLPRVAHDVAQSVDAVALHQAHGAGVVVGPDRLGAIRLRRADEFRSAIRSSALVPADGGRNSPAPFSPVRCSGSARRPGWCTRSA